MPASLALPTYEAVVGKTARGNKHIVLQTTTPTPQPETYTAFKDYKKPLPKPKSIPKVEEMDTSSKGESARKLAESLAADTGIVAEGSMEDQTSSQGDEGMEVVEQIPSSYHYNIRQVELARKRIDTLIGKPVTVTGGNINTEEISRNAKPDRMIRAGVKPFKYINNFTILPVLENYLLELTTLNQKIELLMLTITSRTTQWNMPFPSTGRMGTSYGENARRHITNTPPEAR
jgi:hypothetical protein